MQPRREAALAHLELSADAWLAEPRPSCLLLLEVHAIFISGMALEPLRGSLRINCLYELCIELPFLPQYQFVLTCCRIEGHLLRLLETSCSASGSANNNSQLHTGY